jgi:hypothetical protein
MMKALSIAVIFITSTFWGVAQAENVYNMKYEGYLIKRQSSPGSPSYPDTIAINQISDENLTFSGDAIVWFDKNPLRDDDPYYYNVEPETCCGVLFGNDGSFTVAFDQPVKSVGLNIYPTLTDIYSSFDDLYDTATVSAVYRDSAGEIVGESSVTANWIGQYNDWVWNNTFHGRHSTFGVTNVTGFSEITFSVDGGNGAFLFKGLPYENELGIGSSHLYYTYLNPVPIPEPETYAMMLAGLGMLGFTARRRRQPAATV